MLATCLLSSTGAARADDSAAQNRATLEITFGAAYSADPRVYGVLIKPRWQPALEAEYLCDSYFVSTEHGIGYRIASRDDLTAGIAINYQSGRAERNDARYQGLGSLPGAAEAYAYVEWLPFGPALVLHGDLGRALSHTRGSVYTGGARLGFPVQSGFSAFIDMSVAGGDKRYVQSFYGVSSDQSLRSGYAAYVVRPGPYEISITIGASYDAGPKWTLIAGAGAMHYFGSVAASPILDRRSYPLALIVSNHSF